MFDFAPDTALSLSVVVLCCFFQDGADEAGLERYQLAKGMGREYVVKAGSMGSMGFDPLKITTQHSQQLASQDTTDAHSYLLFLL